MKIDIQSTRFGYVELPYEEREQRTPTGGIFFRKVFPKHGTENAYRFYRCRCYDCTRAATKARAKRN